MLRLYCHRRADAHSTEQLPNVFILQSRTTPGPITPGAVAVDVDVATQASVLRRASLCLQRAQDRVILCFRDQSITQTALGMCRIWVTNTKRKIKRALVIFSEDIEVAFRCAPIALPHLVAHRARAQTDAIRSHQLICR